jgi:two-component system chemotaxis response regulator CheB
MTIRVLVVDDSAFVRKALTRILNQDAEIVVVAQAADGREAIEKVQLVTPDVVTMDLDMPRLGGLATIHEMMRIYPVPIIVVSAWAQEKSALALRALELGAVDTLDKDAYSRMDIHLLANELLPKIKAAARTKPRPVNPALLSGALNGATVAPAPSPPVTASQSFPAISPAAPASPASPAPSLLSSVGLYRVQPIELICIGASTGGPQAVQEVLSHLPREFSVPVVVVQHMPRGFTRLFSERLDGLGGIRVREAEAGARILPGVVTIAQAGQHLALERASHGGLVARMSTFPPHAHTPSVDVLFESAAQVCGKNVAGVLLTGMGTDGARGMVAIRRAGGLTVAESEETCVVYGMPRAASEAGGVEYMLPLPKIAWFLLGWLEQNGKEG